MEFVNYISNGKKDIIKLKIDLMNMDYASNPGTFSKSSKEKSLTLSVPEEIRKILNTTDGEIFEENIRLALKYIYDFEEYSCPRNIIYRKIKTPLQTITLFKGDTTKIKVNGLKFSFILNNNYSITIKDSENNEIETIEKSKENIKKVLTNIQITIFPPVEVEADGIYKIKNFNTEIFNKNEVELFYRSIDEGDNNFDISILEVKLNKNKISDLVKQIEKDSNSFGKKLKKKIIYLGFINSPTIDSKDMINFVKLKKINCAIYGLKQSKFGGKNAIRPIDWDLFKEVKEIKLKLDNIELLLKQFINKKTQKIEKKFSGKKRDKMLSKDKKDDDGDANDDYI